MMQQVRLKVTNSNPMILGLRQALTKRLTIQTLDITVKPTGNARQSRTVHLKCAALAAWSKNPFGSNVKLYSMI